MNISASNGNTQTTPEMVNDQPGQFALLLAHEVRNPLSTINLAVEMLRSAIKDDGLQMYLDIIMRGSTRINNLIKELLKEQDADEVHAEEYSIQQMLDEVLEMAEDRIKLKRISVIKEYDSQDCKIVLNEVKMKIALTNIIINAIDAMTAGKGELRLVAKSTNGKYRIQIADNGCGISKVNLKHIFKAYFTSKPNGLGLGLTKTYDILRSNHVWVNVESEEREGTCFTLLFDDNNQYTFFIK